MELQKKILQQYTSLKSNPTLKEISADTGIQVTRIFRIMNGAMLHLNEYEIFYQRVLDLKQSRSANNLWDECLVQLSPETLSEFEMTFKKKLWLKKLENLGDEALNQETVNLQIS